MQLGICRAFFPIVPHSSAANAQATTAMSRFISQNPSIQDIQVAHLDPLSTDSLYDSTILVCSFVLHPVQARTTAASSSICPSSASRSPVPCALLRPHAEPAIGSSARRTARRGAECQGTMRASCATAGCGMGPSWSDKPQALSAQTLPSSSAWSRLVKAGFCWRVVEKMKRG